MPRKKLITLYHGTSVKNVGSILANGVKQYFEGIYLTDTTESALRWCGFKLHAKGENEVAVIEVKVDPSKLTEGCDHSPMMVQLFGVGKSLLHSGDIPAKNVTNVIMYKLGG